MLIDKAKIQIKAGRGGDGAVSFRREKYVDRGGPDGGDGGKGGSVIFECSEQTHTLFDFYRLKNFKAGSGHPGERMQRHGKDGRDLVLKIPPGTQIFDERGEIIADMRTPGETYIAVKGGKGGLGNVHFKSATHQTPREASPGQSGEEKTITLSLKLIADVGIIGLPNSGKSTLISTLTSARPKIADYPFTTLEPNLGTVKYHDKNIILCDIPGLIEGAAKGKGLGHKFLKHIERTKILIHLVDATSANPSQDYKIIRNELGGYGEHLLDKKEIIVLSKSDLASKLPRDLKYDLAISAATHKNLDKLLDLVHKELN
jgi:GTP-binding protein